MNADIRTLLYAAATVLPLAAIGSFRGDFEPGSEEYLRDAVAQPGWRFSTTPPTELAEADRLSLRAGVPVREVLALRELGLDWPAVERRLGLSPAEP